MKKTRHIDRKSNRKWAMPNQRTATVGMQKMDLRRINAQMAGRNWKNIGKNRGQISKPAAQTSYHIPAFIFMVKSYDGLLPRNVNRSNKGPRKVGSKGRIS